MDRAGGSEFEAAMPRQRTGPACSRKVMNVCACQLPARLLELCKRLWLNALETLPNDRLNPQGKQASVVKDYINVLRSPSTTLWICWSFSCLNRKIASGQNRETAEAPSGITQTLLPGTDPPHPAASSVACILGSLSLCWRVGQRVPEEASTPVPSMRPGSQGYSQHGRAPQQWGLSTWQPGLTWNLGSFGMWAEERKGCRIHMAQIISWPLAVFLPHNRSSGTLNQREGRACEDIWGCQIIQLISIPLNLEVLIWKHNRRAEEC